MDILPPTIGVISGINECVSLFQQVRSAVSSVRSRWNATNMQSHQEDVELHSRSDSQEQALQEDEVLQLQSDLRDLRDTLPVVYSLIDLAEWRNHEQCVAKLLEKLKDAVYEAEDLIDEFAWYELKVSAEGNATSVQPYIDFFRSVTRGRFNKVTDIHKRLTNRSGDLKDMGLLRQVSPRFDKAVRPETSSFPTETKIFGREEEVKQVIKCLGVPAKCGRTNSKRKRRSAIVESASNQVNNIHGNNETIITNFSVLPIVGLGGVGKTTLAQNICNHPQVKSHFDLIIWICVSDDFDVKRLTKEAIQSYSERDAVKDNLNSLQNSLAIKLKTKRLLLVLDDMWDDALKKNGQCWERFCVPLKNVLHGSMILVTTRSQNVADRVHTMDPIKLEGLKDDVFWDFFKHSVFGLNSSQVEPELERIGRNILPKLMGSPLAAKTVGRLLQISIDTTHWENILNSELWDLEQEETDILPALRLSYIYLPLHLKRCFSFCAVYPKDYKFQKQSLAEIWIAEGFVEPRGDIPIENIGHRYFDDLVNRSFFEKHRGTYVIHDLLHDMAQLVSKDECFTIKVQSDFQKIPPSVRHLSILSSTKIDRDSLLSLSRYKKLRTLLCNKSIRSMALASVMDRWCTELLCIRVFLCTSMREFPESISNLKHLRYLEVSWSCTFNSFPSGFCNLYNLQALYAKNCKLECLPSDLSKMINLKRFKSQTLEYHRGHDTSLSLWSYKGEFLHCWFEPRNLSGSLRSDEIPYSRSSVHMTDVVGDNNDNIGSNFSSLTELTIGHCHTLSSLEQFLQPAYVPGIKIIEIKYCDRLVSLPSFRHSSCLEELKVCKCPNINSSSLYAPSLKKLELKEDCGNLADNIDCSSLTYLHISQSHSTSIQLQMWNLPALQKLQITFCRSLAFIGKSEPVISNLSHHVGCSSAGTFPSLTELTISNCSKLQTVDDLHVSFPLLTDLLISHCQLPNGQKGMKLPSSLKSLKLLGCEDLSAWFPRCLENLASLMFMKVHHCKGELSIPGHMWSSNLASLRLLQIQGCPDLVSVGGPKAIAGIAKVWIERCPKFKELKQPVLK
uniref:NB-ARC domain-containing protein n=1 Tax=Setaria italica TaxID=4555 RepID=K3YZU1_SETIT